MKKKITLLRVIVTSFAMFSIFFGAGNFILPPRLGQQAGDHWLLVAIGFCLSAVLIPIAGILVQARLQGSVLDFGKKVSPVVALILGCLLYGMCLAFPMPRTASVSYEMVSTSFTGTIPAWAKYFFYIVYFLLVGYLCYQRNKVLDVLGKYLTPIMVGIIFLLILKAIFSISDIEISSFQKPLAEGLKEGYQTYDAMSSIIIGGVISASLFMDNSLDKSHVLGGVGGLLLSIAVGISCFTTAVGIITGGADFFKEITKGDERTYRIFVTILCVYCVIVAPYGVEYIIKIAYPVLVLFYPVVIVLIFLHLLPSYLASKTVFKVVSLVTFVTTIPLFLEQLGYHFFEVPFPLHEYGVSWLFPAFWAWITTVLIEKTIVKSKK